MSKGSFYSCFTPTKLSDPKGRTMYVNCGKCDYCRNLRRVELSNRVEREILNNRSLCGTILFVTFTYDNEHLPVYSRCSDGIWRSNRKGYLKTNILN